MKTKSKNYYNKDTEDAVIRYVKSKDSKERELIYTNEIYLVFSKLVENIIFKYDFLRLTNNYNDLHQEVMSHLYLNLDKFNPDYGALSYSYFGTAAKRFLQQKSIFKTFENNNIDELNAKDRDDLNDNILIKALNFNNEEKEKEDKEFINILIEHFENKVVKNENEKKIVEAIIYLLKNYSGINIHNKKHFYILIRNFTNLDTKTITKIMNNYIMNDYKEIKDKYINFKM